MANVSPEISVPAVQPITIPVRQLLPYFVGAEEGATSIIGGMQVHEFVHDGRHLLGFPCH